MTRDEFDVWLSGHLAAFPDTQRWLSGIDTPAETLNVWAKVLSETDANAAVEVTERMARGDLDPPPAYERERTAAHVRREAQKIYFSLQTAKRHAYDEPRVSCPVCLDAGSVTVWARRSVEFAKENGKAPAGRYVEAVACTCDRGAGLANKKEDAAYTWSAAPRYDANKYLRPKNATPSKADCEALLEWIGVGACERYAEFDEWNQGE